MRSIDMTWEIAIVTQARKEIEVPGGYVIENNVTHLGRRSWPGGDMEEKEEEERHDRHWRIQGFLSSTRRKSGGRKRRKVQVKNDGKDGKDGECR